MTAALLVNPRSGKRSGHGLALAERVEHAGTAEIVMLDDFAALPDKLAKLAGRGVDTLFISSGDGTIQAIQTELAERGPFERLPRLALLSHGTTNMTAADIGLGLTNLDELARVIADPQALAATVEPRQRPTLRIANARDGHVRHGMFIGAGAVWQATLFCQEAVHRTGLRGSIAPFVTLAAATLRAIFLPAAPDDPTRIDRPHAMRVSDETGLRCDRPQLAFLASTLKRLVLGTKPFWGSGNAPIRVTLFAYPPPNPVRWLIPGMFGGEGRTPPPGTVSFNGERIEVATTSPFVIDGEFFEGPDNEPLVITCGPTFTFLCRR